MIKKLSNCLIIFVLTSNLVAQKIEIKKENDTFILTDKSDKNAKSLKYFNLYYSTFSKDYVIAEHDNPFLINLSTGFTLDLTEYVENLKINNDSCNLGLSDLIRFKTKTKTGLLQFPDKIILQSTFDEIYPQYDGKNFFVLKKGKNYQLFFPKTGKYSITFQLAESSNLSIDNGYSYLLDNQAFFALSDGKPFVIKTDGTSYLLDKSYIKGVDLNYDGISMILCIQDGKFGFVDAYANIVIPFIYEDAKPMNGASIVKYKGKYGIINENGNQIVPNAYDKIEITKLGTWKAAKEGKEVYFNEGGYLYDALMIATENNKYGFSTEDQTILIPCIFDAVLNFSIGTAAVQRAGKWGFILPTGHSLIACQFEDAKSFLNIGLAPVKLNGKWGFIDYEGKFIVEAQYDSVQVQEDNTCHLFKSGSIYTLDQSKEIKFFSVFSEKRNFTDTRDNFSYKTVKIGEQTWMAQNLEFRSDSSMVIVFKESKGKSYGRLYRWNEALKVCPAGWHLPSDDDWKILEKTLGMPDAEINSTYYDRGTKQSAMLKAGGKTGFDVQMSGFLHGYDNNFYKNDEVCTLWTSTPAAPGFAYTRTFFANSDMLNRDNNTYIRYGLPVRCVKD